MEANDKRTVIRNLVKHLNKGCPCERPQGARQSPKSSGFAIIEEIATSPSAPRNDILFNQIWYHLAFANNQEHLLRNLSEERRRIRQHLERAQQDDLCEFVIYPDVTPNEIFDATSFGEPDGSLEQGKAGGSAERNGSDYG